MFLLKTEGNYDGRMQKTIVFAPPVLSRSLYFVFNYQQVSQRYLDPCEAKLPSYQGIQISRYHPIVLWPQTHTVPAIL